MIELKYSSIIEAYMFFQLELASFLEEDMSQRSSYDPKGSTLQPRG